MAIYRASEKPRRQGGTLLEIGKLFKGGPKKKGGTYGDDLDHFRFVPDKALEAFPAEGDAANLLEEMAQRFQSKFGPSPKTLRIQLIYPDIDRSFVRDNRLGSASKNGTYTVTRICDGTTCSRWMDDNYNIHNTPIPCEAKDGDQECPRGCKPYSKLSFRLVDLGYPGLVTLEPKSINDIVNIGATLEASAQTYPEYKLNEITFVLYRYEAMVSTPAHGKQRKWLCGLRVDPAFDAFAEKVRSQNRDRLLRGELAMPLVPEMEDEDDDPDALWFQYIEFLRSATDQSLIDAAEEWALTQRPLLVRRQEILAESRIARDRLQASPSFPQSRQAALAEEAAKTTEPMGKVAQDILLQVRDELNLGNQAIAETLESLYPGKKAKDLNREELRSLIQLIRKAHLGTDATIEV